MRIEKPVDVERRFTGGLNAAEDHRFHFDSDCSARSPRPTNLSGMNREPAGAS
jgi:hypothetical protein